MTSTSYADLKSWKDPAMSVIALIKFNVIFALLYFFEFGFITLAAYGALLGIALGAAATYTASLGIFDLESYVKYDELIENLANSGKDKFVCFAKKTVAVNYWKDYRTTLKVGLAAYIVLYVSDYLNLLVILIAKLNYDFIVGAKKEAIDAVVCPQIEKLKALCCKLCAKIPRATALKKAD
eukprot:GEMP01043273.1.p1 GENE.GEMP01043273.1~~GEMP01043273.1.p1  ORF type:complete len:181 (+),score=34.41 GEMP01043273.1:66-608(+)